MLGLLGDQKLAMTFLTVSVVLALYALVFQKSMFRLMSHALAGAKLA